MLAKSFKNAQGERGSQLKAYALSPVRANVLFRNFANNHAWVELL